jgi:hypothetical protein
MARVVGWLLVPIGWMDVVLGAFLSWSAWDAVAWGFDSFSPIAANAAGLGVIATVAGLGALHGRPRFLCATTAILGVAVVVLAADLFARDAGGSLFGDLDGWQGSDAGGISSLAPVWTLLAEGLVLVAVGIALWVRHPLDGGRLRGTIV